MRKSKRIIIDKIPAIDIRELAKAGAFEGGGAEFPYVSFRYPFLSRLRVYRYRVDMVMRRCATWVFFKVEWSRCNYGGRRPWFRCNLCERRVAKIFGGGIFLGCRHCYELRLPSRLQNPPFTRWRAVNPGTVPGAAKANVAENL